MTNNFIGIYENVLPAPNCQELIDFFEKCDKLGLTRTRQQSDRVSKLDKQDDSFFLTSALELVNYDVVHTFGALFWTHAYQKYIDEYPILEQVAKHQIYSFKMQRTQVGGGYHIWHTEQFDRITSDRLLVFTCYLNDVEEGGETEFLYYPKRVKATQGTFLLFPGSFTHAHRGNPPLSNTKYIVTGWVQFCT